MDINNLSQIRSFGPSLAPKELILPFAFKHNGLKTWETMNDVNQTNRLSLIKQLYPIYKEKDKALIKFLLQQEIVYCQELGDYTDGLNLTAFMLYTIMDISDVPQLYDAKFDTCFDARFVLDIELVFGLNLAETKKYYQEHIDEERSIREVIKEYEDRPHKDRETYLAFYKKRFIPYLLENDEYD